MDPTLTPFSALPWVPPVVGWPVLVVPVSRELTVFGSSHPRFGRKRDGLVGMPCTPCSLSDCWIRGAARCEYSTSEASRICIAPAMYSIDCLSLPPSALGSSPVSFSIASTRRL